MRGRARAAAVLALLGSVSACSTFSEVNAGPVVGLSKNADPTGGVSASAQGGIGFSSDEATATSGVEQALRVKVTKDSQNIALGYGVFGAGRYKDVVAILRGGLQLAFERSSDRLLVGGGPYASLAGGIVLSSREYVGRGFMVNEWRRERTLLTVGPAVELDARFSRSDYLTFVGFNIGIAWANAHIPTPPDPPADPLAAPAVPPGAAPSPDPSERPL